MQVQLFGIEIFACHVGFQMTHLCAVVHSYLVHIHKIRHAELMLGCAFHL